MTGLPVLTSLIASVDASSSAELVRGFAELTADELPEGLLRTELLHSHDGSWRVQSLWRDRESLLAARATGARPAALLLFDRLGTEQSHEAFEVEVSIRRE